MGTLWAAPQYEGASIDPDTLLADPIDQFRAWMGEAVAAAIPNANAMTLATVNADGKPSARIVLLKDVDARGFTFFTNYTSKKGDDIAANPNAALVFYWDALHRQVRVEGTIERVDGVESDAYFGSRPRGSQIGAIASPQSRVIGSRDELVAKVAEVEAQLGDGVPVRPVYWGGYRVQPAMIELWQGQPSRLHDRVRYARSSFDENAWIRERLAP